MVFNYVITVANIPRTLAAMLKAYELTPIGFLLVRECVPFLAVMIAALAVITFVPSLTLFLPRLMGYQG